jgi:hypothetical protein
VVLADRCDDSWWYDEQRLVVHLQSPPVGRQPPRETVLTALGIAGRIAGDVYDLRAHLRGQRGHLVNDIA